MLPSRAESLTRWTADHQIDLTAVSTDIFKISGVVENEGYLPTYITQRALDAEVAVPVRLYAQLSDAVMITGAARTDLGHLIGSRDAQQQSADATARRAFEYVVRVTGSRPSMTITARSQKGGVARRALRLRRRAS